MRDKLPGLSDPARLQAPLAAADPPVDPSPELRLDAGVSGANGLDEYGRLQRRLLLATALVGLAATLVTAVIWGGEAARSLLLGACCGLLYLRLLARSVGRLGPESRSLGRFQIVVPALLVVAAARVPAIQLLPALAGFLLYKPALLLQAVLAP